MSLFDKLRFGRRKPQSSSPPSSLRAQAISLPWKDKHPDEMLANFAIGNLRETLMGNLKSERGVHAETLMVVIGAIAGYAAAHALWETRIKPGHLKLMRDVHVVEAKNGTIYYFGDPLNALLAPEQRDAPSLYGVIAGSAHQVGVPAAELPDYSDIFRHVSSVIGTDSYGVVRAPSGVYPSLTATQALHTFWPLARGVLSSSDNPAVRGYSLPVERWPLVTSLVAAQFIANAKDVLDPRISMRLVMEAAVFMSKVDPRTVPQTLPSAS